MIYKIRAYLLNNYTQLHQVPQTNVAFHEVHYAAKRYHRVRMHLAVSNMYLQDSTDRFLRFYGTLSPDRY